MKTTENMASKSNTKVCRLCRSVVESTKTVHLFSSTRVERRAPRTCYWMFLWTNQTIDSINKGGGIGNAQFN